MRKKLAAQGLSDAGWQGDFSASTQATPEWQPDLWAPEEPADHDAGVAQGRSEDA